MSAQAYSGLRASRSGPRWGLVIACAFLIAATAVLLARDVQERRDWAAVTREHDGAHRFPAALQTANVIDENGESGIVISEALADAPVGDGAKEAPGSGSNAREVILGVIKKRPGSSLARLSLGRTAAMNGPTARWARPLGLATSAAPGLDLAWNELGSRYLASWESLSPDERLEAEAVLRRAFANPDFLRAALPTAVETLGPERSIQTLPGDPATLRRAAQILQEAGDERTAVLVVARLTGQARGPGS